MPIFGFTNIPGSVITQTSIAVASGGASDPDAQAFITAASITDATQISAIDQLVIDLKNYGVWNNCLAIYPIVGGSASSHAVNLKTPGTYNLTFSTGWTHASTGMTPSSAYADTAFNPSVSGSLNSAHLSYYSRTNSNGTEVEIGCAQGSDYSFIEIRTAGTSYVLLNQSALSSFADANSQGFYIGNRQASNDIDGWKNGVKQLNGTTASTIRPNRNIFIGALNSATTQYYSIKQCAFASIGNALTDTQATNFYTAVQAYQTTLSRNV